MKEAELHAVVIIEDNADMRLALEAYLQAGDTFHVVGSYDNCEEALDRLALDQPRIVLMDVDLPGMNGIEGTKKVKREAPRAEVIIITVFENSETVFSALSSGASGYLTKTVGKEELLSALHECLEGGAPMSMKIAKMVVSSFKKSTKSPLSERETEVLSCLASGKSYNSTAEHLFISKDTVKFHIKNIYIKLQVNSKEEAIALANKNKYI